MRAHTQQGVNLSLAAYPGLEFHEAMERAHRQPPTEPLLGALSLCSVQLCPQNRGVLTLDYVDMLCSQYPHTQFRLHANVRVLPNRQIVDWSAWSAASPYWKALAAASQRMHAPAYTAHAGRRSESSLADIFAAAREAADVFGCTVGIEGLYPSEGDVFLISTWAEYRALFESGVPYALDLSHLNIVASHSGKREETLIQEMLSCERCIEVHLSANDGVHDQHKLLDKAPWWWELMDYVHPGAAIFSEGTQRGRAQPA